MNKKEHEGGLLKAYRERLELARVYEKNLRSIVEAGHDMAASGDISEIMVSMLELAVKITGAQFACAALMGKSSEVFYSFNVPEKNPVKFPIDTGFDRTFGLGGLLMRTKKHYICNIVEDDRYLNRDVKDEYKIKNYISVPLLAKKGNFLGLMDVYNKNLFEPFDENDADILDTLASFTAIAVERFRIYSEFGKFGEEVEKIVEETLEAENELKKECKKHEYARKELELMKKDVKKARILAQDIVDMKISGVSTAKEKAAEICRLFGG